jgi:hypothetical protein
MALLTISQHIGCARQSGLLTSRLVGACPRCGVASLTTEHLGKDQLGRDAQDQCRPLSATAAQCGCSGSAATPV